MNTKNIILGATILLLIPLLGNMFVSGWNWTITDFIFAWVFLIVFGLTFKFVTSKIVNRTYKIASGVAIVLVFVSIWVILATG